MSGVRNANDRLKVCAAKKMREIDLGYGRGTVSLRFDEDRFHVLAATKVAEHPLSDAEIGAAFDAPVQSPIIEEIFAPGDTILIVVSDATRATASAQILNLLIRRLIQLGIPSHDLGIIFATGIDRAVTDEEKSELFVPFVFQ